MADIYSAGFDNLLNRELESGTSDRIEPSQLTQGQYDFGNIIVGGKQINVSQGQSIQSAIDEVESDDGGTIFIQSGTYEIEETIKINNDNIALVGEGALTIIKLKNGANSKDIIEVGDGSTAYENILISNLKFDGNKANVTGDTNGRVFFNTNITKSAIRNCFFIDARGDSIYLLDSNENLIAYNDVQNSADISNFGIKLNSSVNNTIIYNISKSNITGIQLTNTSDNNTVIGNHCDSNTDGINIGKGAYNIIMGNSCDSNTTEGIVISNDSGNHNNIISNNSCESNTADGIYVAFDKNIIIGNSCRSNGNRGIYLSAGDYNTISNNICQLNNHEGIELYFSNYNTVSGNVCSDNSQLTNDTYADIHLYSVGSNYSTYNIVTGNICNATQDNKVKYGIRENAAGDDYNLIHGNIVQNAVTANISTQGANTVSTDNIG